MLAKTVVVGIIVIIGAMLARALVAMIRDGAGDKARMVKFLRLRVAFSALLIAVLILSVFMGWIAPHGVAP